jgi:signal transduction histidine kinase
VRLSIEAAAFFWAIARLELPSRLRLALGISAWASVLTALNYLAMLPPELGGPALLSDAVDTLGALASYALAIWALAVYPRAPARPGERASMLIDFVVTGGGLGLLSWTLVTLPTAAQVGAGPASLSVFVFGVAQVGLLIALNVVVIRGVAIPSRRAFWWFVAGQAGYLPVVLLTQLESTGVIDLRWSTIVYFLGVLPTLVAAVMMRADPLVEEEAAPRPVWIRDFNPLPLLMPVAVGAFLLIALTRGSATDALPLAAGLVAISLLLALRLTLSAHQASRLARAEVAAEQQRQRDKMQAVARLAGGVAHEFNNLMTRVIGHADLGEATLPPNAPARREFDRVRSAADRAAALTRQLLAFSGRQSTQFDRLDAVAWLRTAFPALQLTLSPEIEARLTVSGSRIELWADGAQLDLALRQIATNAVEAMPDGGRLDVSLEYEDLAAALQTPLLQAAAGRYAVLRVRDTGRGIRAQDLPSICDPFFSTKSRHLGAGLGLASVYGIVAVHSGGLAAESTPGVGTTISVYLPAT